MVCVFTPLLILWLTYKSSTLNKIGSIIIAYVIGCLLGLTGLVPATPEAKAVQDILANATIPLAIPLMLFSSNVRAWASLAPSFIKSLIFGICGCVCAVTVGFVLFGGDNPSLFANIGGMLTGLYTGGTANLASLKVALGVDDGTYLQVHTYSIVVSALYLLFVVVFGQRALGRILPRFTADKNDTSACGIKIENHDNELFLGLFRRDNMPHLGRAMLYTVLIVAVGGGVAKLAPEDTFLAVFILTISLLSVLASLLPAVRSTKRTFEAGTYFILIFSLAVSSQVNIDLFYNIDFTFFLFTFTVTMGALLCHMLLSAIFRIDTDTTLVTSISLICSPPFVPVMAGALNNRAVLGPGIAVGLVGYAVGTYLGFGLAKALVAFFV